MNVVFLGATKGMGRALARRMVARGDRLFLLGRDSEELARTAADLAARGANGGGVAGSAELDLGGLEDAGPCFASAAQALGRVEAVVVTAGQFAPQDQLEADLALTARVLDVDFTRTVLFCEAARRCLLASGGGTLCVFSSVAGDRGRGAQVLYGAAKAGLSSYLEALDHRWHRSGLRVVCVKPGFVRTGMTAGLPEPPFAGEPDAVAQRVLRAVDRGTPVVYAPGIWRWVMLVIRWLPRGVMRRVRF
jgi:decaprenylphospho-beta-D-erythro-pentofuranosid-2-ulose 2-reductase